MRAFLPRILVFFLAPLGLAALLELAVFPIDHFTFRSWEALRVERDFFLLKGPFYPNARLVRDEVGGQVPHSPHAVTKSVEWITDADGYRKAPGGAAIEIVIVGDSMTAGTSLTQDDILSEVLERELQRRVYPLAPSRLRNVLQERRFLEEPPRVVVLQMTERKRRLRSFKRSSTLAVTQALPNVALLQRLAVSGDRVLKQPMLQALRARIRRALYPTSGAVRGAVPPGHPPMYFGERGGPSLAQWQAEIPSLAARIGEYHERFAASEIRFIFLPIPKKETLYRDLLPTGGSERPESIPRLVEAVREAGVEALDT
jgi:hypothetical protein